MNAILVLLAIQGFVGIAFLAFLVGVVITVFVLLGSGKATIRVQQIAPPGKWKEKRVTAAQNHVYTTLKPYLDDDWVISHTEVASGVGKYVITLKRFEWDKPVLIKK